MSRNVAAALFLGLALAFATCCCSDDDACPADAEPALEDGGLPLGHECWPLDTRTHCNAELVCRLHGADWTCTP